MVTFINKPWKAVLFISLISVVDFQFLAEGSYSSHVSPTGQRVGHLAALLSILWVGCSMLKNDSEQVFRLIWLCAYALVLSVAIVFGITHYYFHFFSYSQLATIGMLRAFFTTPLPFLMLRIMQKSFNA
jgi:heme A synthase